MSGFGRKSHVKVSYHGMEASAVCDLCDERWNHSDLKFQWDWSGSQMINSRFLRCPNCIDRPSNRFRAIELRPDPQPVRNARPRNWSLDETDYIEDEVYDMLTDENGNLLTRD